MCSYIYICMYIYIYVYVYIYIYIYCVWHGHPAYIFHCQCAGDVFRLIATNDHPCIWLFLFIYIIVMYSQVKACTRCERFQP